MKPRNDLLERLLRGAAAVPPAEPGEMPFPLKTRVLASWRDSLVARGSVELALFLRRAVAVACTVSIVLLLAGALGAGLAPSDEWTFAVSMADLAVAP